MTPQDVKAIIAAELRGDLSRTNLHGVDLQRCLVEPRRVACINTFPEVWDGELIDLWVVLEEAPGTAKGYLIVFDEESREFGLAHRSGSAPVFLGIYGTFIDTFDGM